MRLYFPSSHREQFTEAPVLNVPASQAEQLELPLLLVCVPAGQSLHVLWPEALWYLAIGHASHTEEPTVDATFPESHAVHVMLASDDE